MSEISINNNRLDLTVPSLNPTFTTDTYRITYPKQSKQPHFSGFYKLINKGNYQEVYIKEVIYSNPATIVFWSDGTKTVCKCHAEDEYSPEGGLAMCVLKKLVGTNEVRELFDDWVMYGDGIVSTRDVRRKHQDDDK